MKLPTVFGDFIKRISLTEGQRNALKKAHNELQFKLANDESLKNVYVTTFLQGSYKRSTAIKPVNGSSSDVDVVLVTIENYQETKPSVFLNKVFCVAKKYYPDCCRLQGRSIGISLNEVDMDLVPTAVMNASGKTARDISNYFRNYDDTIEEMYSKNRKYSWMSDNAVYDKSEPLMISDRKTEEWERTHPIAQIEWTQEKNSRCNGYYLSVVKSLKWWHKVMHPEEEHPNSYPLEHFIGECCPDGIVGIAEGIVLTLEKMATIVYKPILLDRGVPEHDVFARVTEAEYKEFNKSVREAASLARRAYDSTDYSESVRLWKELFGDEFPSSESTMIEAPHFSKRTEPSTELPKGNFA